MIISIVIPTFNRARLLLTTIPALADQELRDGLRYEIVFVSNGSTDNTAEVIEAAIERHPGLFRYFRIEATGGPSAPRNAGIREARGEVIVILDDDVKPDRDLVLRHAQFHQSHPEPQAAAVGEAYVPEHLCGDPVSLFHVYPYDRIRGIDQVGYDYFWTCNVSFKRQFMLEHGMFDERFLFNEDVICGHKLDRAGMCLHFVPEARGQHLHQLTLAGLPAKAEFTGRWIYATVRELPEPAVIERYGVLSPELGPWRFARRLVRRIAFRVVDNPLTHAMLRALGSENGRRNRWSDIHYGLLFRRWVVAGYYKALREAAGARSQSPSGEGAGWRNRGDK
jgi:glycosyltransferase involved in cell wall biosynthesis